MSGIVEHLEALTGSRDRELLEVTLIGAFRDLLRPVSVGIWRLLSEGEDRRWVSRARIGSGDTVAGADPPWTAFSDLPPLADHPHRERALVTGVAVHVPPLAVFPIGTERDSGTVLELETAQPLAPAERQLIASVLRIYGNFIALLDYSERDTLTGLLNRKTFDEQFLRLTTLAAGAPAVADGRREGGAACPWLAVIDIDHFKRVNDDYGHLIGDEVLLLLARLMRGCFRSDDRLYRFGGEEFVVVMRCHGVAGAMLAFERLRAAVEQYRFPQVGGITVSIGFTEMRHGDTPSAAFERADKAVYWIKGHGRNGCGDHADLVARGEIEDAATTAGDVELF